MKFKYLAFFMSLVAATGFAFAHDKSNSYNDQHGMWTCESNASSSSYTSADNTANTNNNMNNNANSSSNEQAKPRSAKEAFAYALKNCKDCTKITCEMQKK